MLMQNSLVHSFQMHLQMKTGVATYGAARGSLNTKGVSGAAHPLLGMLLCLHPCSMTESCSASASHMSCYLPPSEEAWEVEEVAYMSSYWEIAGQLHVWQTLPFTFYFTTWYPFPTSPWNSLRVQCRREGIVATTFSGTISCGYLRGTSLDGEA